jgi:hypothetical protein
MTFELGTYSFLPWLRQGIANQLQAANIIIPGKTRPTFNVALTLKGDNGRVETSVSKDIEIYGPGDVIGIGTGAAGNVRGMILKTEPGDWITNFEPNYLPYIEFYDEDFPWRYTPEVPDRINHRLRPWIMLTVLKEEVEFEDGQDIQNIPLPYIEVKNINTAFPPSDQLWAWAHVHINRDLAVDLDSVVSDNIDDVLRELQMTLKENPDLAYSRIICPRRLEPNTAYHAFLVPVFETGRLAGLGLDPTKSPSLSHVAWDAYSTGTREQSQHIPYYHRWYFRTGAVGDFEYLVRLLEQKPIDSRVGQRDMDVTNPGLNLAGIDDPELNGVLKLGGALQISSDQREETKYEEWYKPFPQHPFQLNLAAFINLAEDYREKTATEAHEKAAADTGLYLGTPDPSNTENTQIDPDPLITPPLYGQWHARMSRLLQKRERNGVVPGCGFVFAFILRLLGIRNGNCTYDWLHELNLDPRFRVAAGFGTRVVQQNQEAYVNAAFKQIGEVLKANHQIRLAQLAKEITGRYYERHVQPLQTSNFEKVFTLTNPLHKRVVEDGKTVHFHVNTSLVPNAILSTTARRLFRPRGRTAKTLGLDGKETPDNLITRISKGEITAAPPKSSKTGIPIIGNLIESLIPDDVPSDTPSFLERFSWLGPLLLVFLTIFAVVIAWLLQYVGPAILCIVIGVLAIGALLIVLLVPVIRRLFRKMLRKSLDLKKLTKVVVETIDPGKTIPRHTYSSVFLPEHVRKLTGDGFVEAMAYPQIDLPMYKPLINLSTELFLPNINYVDQNSISLLETNQKFIEAYMAGLNHEFARELLWREYPTDQRGSYFRQFWDVSGFLDNTTDREDLKEKLRDIPPLHRWSRDSSLGDHDYREESGTKEEEVVLLIRGELLKKYPTAVIYAHRAKWQMAGSKINVEAERELVDLEEDEQTNLPRSKIRTPLYEAKVEPDIYFFGFDLTTKEARGGTGELGDEDPGWFFVIKERPGEPRFGLDIGKQEVLNVWNDLSWEDVMSNEAPGKFITITDSFQLHEPDPNTESEKCEQYKEDKWVHWGTNSAEMAYILFQSPVIVAVHATTLLPCGSKTFWERFIMMVKRFFAHWI